MTVAELLTDESKWTQGTYARDAGGDSVLCREAKACRWCLLGAMRVVYGGHRSTGFDSAFRRLRDAIGRHVPVHEWNDTPGRTFAEVRAAIEKAGI